LWANDSERQSSDFSVPSRGAVDAPDFGAACRLALETSLWRDIDARDRNPVALGGVGLYRPPVVGELGADVRADSRAG
jgi:hypothetical protein